MTSMLPYGHAAQYDRYDVIRSLIAHGAAIDEQDRRGNTAMDMAYRLHHMTTVRLLLDAGSMMGNENMMKKMLGIREPTENNRKVSDR